MRARRFLFLALALAATALLSGCLQITGLSTSQPGTVGPVKLSHDVCYSPSSTCPEPLADNVEGGQVQLLAAYRIPNWAPDPTVVRLRMGAQVLDFVPEAAYAQALLAERPGLARSGQRWVSFRAASGQPALAKNALVTAKLESSFDLPDDDARLFSHFTVVGFRWLVVPGSPGSSLSPTRAFVCGQPVPGAPGVTGFSDAACVTGFWPRASSADTDPTDDSSEFVTRNRLQLSPGATQQVLPGQRAQFSFPANGSPTLPGTTVPLSASTTAAGAGVTAPASLTLAANGSVPVEIDVPAATPPGDYEVRLFAGVGADGRRATATLRVLAPAAAPTPTPTVAPSLTPTPTPGAGDVAATFAESVASAAATLNAAGAREALKKGRLRIKVRASAKGRVVAELRTGRRLLAKGQITARRKGVVLVKLKLTKAGSSALAGRDALAGTLKVRFRPSKGRATTTSVAVTIPAS